MITGGENSFWKKLCSGNFIISSELTPPRHYNMSRFMQTAEIIKEYVDVIQLNDHLLSKARISNLVAGHQCKSANIETILQFTLRHRNKIAIQGDLLGMAAYGLQNLIVLGGYPCRIGSDPDASDIDDIDSLTAIKKIKKLTQEGCMFNGEIISPPPPFRIGTIFYPCSSSIDKNVDELERKIEAGAEFVQIQAIFENEPFQQCMEMISKRGLHHKAKFLAAVMPFSNAEKLNALGEIPGLVIPEELTKRIQKHDTIEECLLVTLDLINEIRNTFGISGVHIRSIGVEEWVPKIIEASGLKPTLVY